MRHHDFCLISIAAFVAIMLLESSDAFQTPIYIINLDKDTERLDKVTRELVSKGVPHDKIERLPAVYGKDLSLEELRSNTSYLARTFCTKGMIGCYLSHRKFWEKAYYGSQPYQIVLEDDVILTDDFYNKCEESILELQQCDETKDKWDVLLLGAFGPVHPDGKHGPSRLNAFMVGGGRRRRPNVTKHCQVPRRPLGTHAYVLSKRGAEKLLCRAWYATGHVDCVIWGIKELNIYCRHPMLAFQDMSSPSTIGSVTWGPETWIPDTWKVDEYSGVTLNWALNEPLIQIPGLFLLTIGRALVGLTTSFGLGIFFRKVLPWLLPINMVASLALFLLLRAMSIPKGRSGVPLVGREVVAAAA